MIIGVAGRRVAALVLCAGALAGCSSSSVPALPSPTGSVVASAAVTQSPSPSVSGSATPSVSASAVAKPVLPEAAAASNDKGAEAFVRYFVDIYNYAYQSLDASALQAISLPSCKFCASAVADIDAARAAGNRVIGGDAKIVLLIVAPGQAETGLLVSVKFDQSASQTQNSSGAVVASSAAEPAQRANFVVVWRGGSWKLAGVEVIQ